jgi:hypothetical protein
MFSVPKVPQYFLGDINAKIMDDGLGWAYGTHGG